MSLAAELRESGKLIVVGMTVPPVWAAAGLASSAAPRRILANLGLSAEPSAKIVTYSLGSCVGVSLFDPVACVGGLIHCMLPLSSTDMERAKEKPYMFVDTGVVRMLGQLYEMGATKENLVCKVAGGASPLDDNGVFRIGERNYAVLRKVLWKNNIMIAKEDVGGKCSRTMILHMNDGRTTLKINSGKEVEL